MTGDFAEFQRMVANYHKGQVFLAVLNNGGGTLSLEGRGLVSNIDLQSDGNLDFAETIGRAMHDLQVKRLKQIKEYARDKL